VAATRPKDKALPMQYKTTPSTGHKPDMMAPFPERWEAIPPILCSQVLKKATEALKRATTAHNISVHQVETNPSWWINHAVGRYDLLPPLKKATT